MAEIRILSDNVANQIAAGEVVERPMSVIKELLENAIDAGATRINIEFRNGGRSYMSIEDNGCGMSKDQALLALERHATSKIRSASDLDTIHSFGFRGEALPSIASVSKFTIKTRPESEIAGTEIFIKGGKYVSARDIGMPQGTKIEVSDLFFNVPARLKFLKSENTEAAHITRAIRLYAVAHPNIAFTLWENGKEIFRSPANIDILDRVAAIWGRQLAEDLIPLPPSEVAGMKLHGLIGKPGVSRSSRQEMVTIVNGRPVDNRTMAYALVESYHTMIPRGRYPLAFIFLEIDPHAVDVNVHPAKREIRFRDDSKVRNFLIKSVLGLLLPQTSSSEDLRPVPILTNTPHRAVPAAQANYQAFPQAQDLDQSKAEAFPQAKAYARESSCDRSSYKVPQAQSPAVPAEASPSQATKTSPALPAEWQFIGQLKIENISLFQFRSNLILFNLRLAEERIWFERILERFRKNEKRSQPLLIPEPIEFDPLSADTLLRHLRLINDMGFEVEEFGRNFFRINSVPDWLESTADPKEFLRDIVAKIARIPAEFSREKIAYESLAKLAGSHVGQHRKNFDDQYLKLVLKELFSCKQPNVAPSGQKIFVEITQGEILKRFGV